MNGTPPTQEQMERRLRELYPKAVVAGKASSQDFAGGEMKSKHVESENTRRSA